MIKKRASVIFFNLFYFSDHSIDSEGALFIPRVREEDGGRYECKGRSEFGPTSHPVVLVVGGKYTGIHSADRETFCWDYSHCTFPETKQTTDLSCHGSHCWDEHWCWFTTHYSFYSTGVHQHLKTIKYNYPPESVQWIALNFRFSQAENALLQWFVSQHGTYRQPLQAETFTAVVLEYGI